MNRERRRETVRAAAVTLASAGGLALCGALDAPPALLTVALVGCVALAAAAPVGALGAVVVALPWFYSPVPVGTAEFPASELLLATALIGLGLHFLAAEMINIRSWGQATRRPSRLFADLGLRTIVARVGRSRTWVAATSLAALGLLHLLWLHERTPFDAAAREWRWTLLEPALLVAACAAIATPRSRTYLAGCLVVGAGLAALAGLVEVLAGGGVVADGARRATGPYPHPNALALYLVRGWALVAAWWVWEPRHRAWLTLPVVLTTLGLAATLSRGALAAAVVAGFIIALRAAPRLRLFAAIVGGGLVALLIAVASGRMLDTFSGGSASLRLEIWRSAFGMVRDAPVWGYGPDGFLYSYAPRYVSPSAWAERFTAHAHNLLLDAWIRLGIIGAAIVAVALVACLLVVYQRVLRRDGGHGLDTVALVALVTVFVHGMVDNAYFGHDLAMSTWLLMWLAVDRRGNAVEGDSVSGAHPGDRRRRLYRLAPV